MKQISFMCDDDVYQLIETWGHDNDRSFSEAIRHGLRMFFSPSSIPAQQKRGRTAFEIPTVDQLRSYMITMKYDFDPEQFHAFYESKGWKVGNQPMRDWRAACVTWQKRHESNNPTKKTNGGYKPLPPEERERLLKAVADQESKLPPEQRRTFK